MQTIFSTAEVHPRDRFDYWHEVACKTLVSHGSKPECAAGFFASLESGTLADLGLVTFEIAALAVWRASRHLAHTTTDELFICIQAAGTLGLEQCSRDVLLQEGDVTLLDPSRPYNGHFSSNARLLVVKVPRRALEARVGPTHHLALRPIRSHQAEHRLLSSYLVMLPDLAETLDHAAQDLVRDQTLDLLALSLVKAEGGEVPRISSARSLALLRVRAAIDARLTDPVLTPAIVAAAAGMSVRYANALLAEEGTSVARLIQSRRLDRCRRVLEDPAQGHRTVSDIAYGWGFADMTHFGRRFKAAFGASPRDHRKIVLQSFARGVPRKSRA
jgi:AraC family transcriptional activator of tynA and feaB